MSAQPIDHHWSDQFIPEKFGGTNFEPSAQLEIVLGLMTENPLEHFRFHRPISTWWEILVNCIITMILERDNVSIYATSMLLTELQQKGSQFSYSDQESRHRLQGYLDILKSAKTHF